MTGVGLAMWKMGLPRAVAIHLAAVGIFINYLSYLHLFDKNSKKLNQESKKVTYTPEEVQKSNNLQDIEAIGRQKPCSSCSKGTFSGCSTACFNWYSLPQEINRLPIHKDSTQPANLKKHTDSLKEFDSAKKEKFDFAKKEQKELTLEYPLPLRSTLPPYAFAKLLHRSIFNLLIDSVNKLGNKLFDR